MMSEKMIANLNKAAADTFKVELINIAELHESMDNFFTVDRIEELAETIFGQGGVKENLIVQPRKDGGYEIISGHRRAAAIRFLIKQGKTVSKFLPCHIANFGDDDDKKLNLILMNVSARVISDDEMFKSYELVNEILQKKKQLGEKFGRIRDKLAEILGISLGQVAKIQNIENNAISEVKEAVKSGEMSINTAEKLAKLDKEEQEKAVSEASVSGLKPRDFKSDNKKSVTNDTFSADDSSDEKSVTSDTFSDNTSDESYPTKSEPPQSTENAEEMLMRMIKENRYMLITILNNYVTDDTDVEELDLIDKVEELLKRL
jgi:ParB-like chromosome segregation protein Spo0J